MISTEPASEALVRGMKIGLCLNLRRAILTEPASEALVRGIKLRLCFNLRRHII